MVYLMRGGTGLNADLRMLCDTSALVTVHSFYVAEACPPSPALGGRGHRAADITAEVPDLGRRAVLHGSGPFLSSRWLIGLRPDSSDKNPRVIFSCVVVSPNDGSHVRVGSHNLFEILFIAEYEDLIVTIRVEPAGLTHAPTPLHAPGFLSSGAVQVPVSAVKTAQTITYVLRKSAAKKMAAASSAVSHKAIAISESTLYGVFPGFSK